LILKKQHEAIIAGMMQNLELEKEKYVLLHTEMGNGVDYMMYSHAGMVKHQMMHN
jgi:hypothetical protein